MRERTGDPGLDTTVGPVMSEFCPRWIRAPSARAAICVSPTGILEPERDRHISDRDIARSRLMGRPKVAAFRTLAGAQGWLAVDAPLPDDATIAALIGRARRARSTSVSLYRCSANLRIDRMTGKRNIRTIIDDGLRVMALSMDEASVLRHHDADPPKGSRVSLAPCGCRSQQRSQ
jgi:hypothetical protein